MLKSSLESWTTSDAAQLYEVPRWGKEYFTINSIGNVMVHPTREPHRGIDLKELVDRVQLRGLDLPVLIRFKGILQDRLKNSRRFAEVIREHEYRGEYACAYPIKVNQQRPVVEQIVRKRQRYGFGLEAGSKPELLAVVAMTDDDTPIICNGFKDCQSSSKWR